jgi:UDP-3-O-acyl-N-acetylglucosamine deacetylase
VFKHEGAEGLLHAEPSESFSVEYELDRPPLRQQFRLDHPAIAINEILPARTFIFTHEWDQAKARGLLQGCGPDSGMLYASTEKEFETAKGRNPDLRGKRFPLLHPETERVEQEAVKHKILDLLGDLALLGLALPRLRLRIRNGGHALNHLLLEQLQNERTQSHP